MEGQRQLAKGQGSSGVGRMLSVGSSRDGAWGVEWNGKWRCLQIEDKAMEKGPAVPQHGLLTA